LIFCHFLGGKAYHSQRPKEGVVDNHPPLLREASQFLAVCDALEFPQRSQDHLHSAGAKAGEKDDAKQDNVGVVDSDSVFARCRIVI
jgi:hypothetical protein